VTVFQKENDIIIEIDDFDISHTLDCGQCFRFDKIGENEFFGIAKGKALRISQNNNQITFFNTTLEDFNKIWVDYFDLLTDYNAIKEIINTDTFGKKSIEYCSGIRILKQNSWEALCSFIISQNNNIPRIKGIIKKLCENFGDKIEGGYAFPSPEVLSKKSVEDLSIIRAGFRAKYILDACEKIVNKEIDLKKIYSLDIDSARQELTKIYGVGAKVAECALLFGFYRIEAFPIDVWIKRVLEKYYDGDFPEQLKPIGGIAQQYLFHYIRNNKCD
jgi:N-glycosylase/DNA lyase